MTKIRKNVLNVVFGDSILYEKGDSIEREGKYIFFGKEHFVKFDTDNLVYDFRLLSKSAAVGWANPKSSAPDRDGTEREQENLMQVVISIGKRQKKAKAANNRNWQRKGHICRTCYIRAKGWLRDG